MRRLFISDLHLEDKRPDITRAFFHLLDTFSSKIDELYILGDFFEVWLGDDFLTPTASTVAEKLKAFSSSARIYILHGNRDFLLGQTYANQCGASLLEENHLIQIGNDKALLMHGDTLCTEDKPYMDFRTMVRNPQWQAMFLAKPIEERIAYGRQARNQSQEETQHKSDDILDVTAAEVERVIAENHVSLLIHGHTHRPARHSLEQLNAERIVLGDWHKQGWYLLCDDQSIDLKSFEINR